MEIYGPEASGKTTLALHAIAEAQKQGGKTEFPKHVYLYLSSTTDCFDRVLPYL